MITNKKLLEYLLFGIFVCVLMTQIIHLFGGSFRANSIQHFLQINTQINVANKNYRARVDVKRERARNNTDTISKQLSRQSMEKREQKQFSRQSAEKREQKQLSRQSAEKRDQNPRSSLVRKQNKQEKIEKSGCCKSIFEIGETRADMSNKAKYLAE